jgi:DNA-binding response OmpR family regulator
MNRRARVLLIENESQLREILRDVLTVWGYDVDVAPRGLNGLRLFEEGRHDLVLTDFLMPGMTGFEVGEALRESDPGARMIVIAGSLDREIDRTPGHGFTLLKKPFEMRDLKLAMGRCLRMFAKGSA